MHDRVQRRVQHYDALVARGHDVGPLEEEVYGHGYAVAVAYFDDGFSGDGHLRNPYPARHPLWHAWDAGWDDAAEAGLPWEDEPETSWLDVMPTLPSDGTGAPLIRTRAGAVVDLDQPLGFAWAFRWLTLWMCEAPTEQLLNSVEFPIIRGHLPLERWAMDRTTEEDRYELARACAAAVTRTDTVPK